LDAEQPNIVDLQSLTASHTTDIASNTKNISNKQDLTSNLMIEFELNRFSNNVVQLNSNIDSCSIIAYNKNTGI
jgi:hypothetical protein